MPRPDDPLSTFSARTRAWFESSYAEPTPAQALAWPAIAGGEHVLLSAPTGSGKTLAAFLWALDRLSGESPPVRGGRSPGGVRVLYVSPLKALSYDIERNLRAPLRGIGADVSVGIRTGDTSQGERAAMARKPPEILITTPESLYLILGSRARAMLRTVETVIVDEIHAVAASKRGAHLALTLERLDGQVRADRNGREVQRVGLSATQRPLEEIGRFLVGPRRKVRILDAGARTLKGTGKQLDLRIHVPVESMTELDSVPADPLEPAAGGSLRNSPVPERGIWPAIYPELLALVREHRSTIVFVNNRRSAERVALRLNEFAAAEGQGDGDGAALPGGLPGVPSAEREPSPQGDIAVAHHGSRSRDEREPSQQRDIAIAHHGSRSRDEHEPAPQRDIARAHHGSLSREERTLAEEQLKAGELPCLVATSSLELGIDMGAVDLVLQVESPKSVARGLQRIGRAGHGVGDVSKGRIFPKFRGDLLECAVVCRRMREGEIEPTVVPRNALDVLAQQIVAIAAAAEDGQGGDGSVGVDDLYALVTASYSYGELPRSLLENVLDMLDGRYPSSEFGDLRARIVWDRVAGRIRARRGARQLAIANAGTIPDRGLYAVVLPDGRRVGELDEEMVYEARPGQVFALGASSWRIEEIGRDRVIVTPAPGVPGAVPFWKGDGIGRPKELGRAIGEFARWAVDQEPELLVRDYDLDERSARNLLDYLREQQQATQVLPSDRTIVLERFRDEIGDWRLCLLSPYGGRVHAAWALAISARFKELFGLDGEALWSDDGIVLRLPDVDLLDDRVGEGEYGAGEGAGGYGRGDDAGGAGEGAGGHGKGDDVGGAGEGAGGHGKGDGAGGYGEGAGGAGDGAGGLAAERGWERSALSAGDAGARSYADLVALDPEEVQEAIVSELGGSALFGARFRENAGRALLIPRAYPGRRTPLWQQRLKAQGLLEVARRYPDFPIVLETYRECLRDVLDLDGLTELLRALATREVSLVEVQTQSASPFAGSLLFDYVATYMYEGDTPAAERRAAALSLDRDLLRELLGQEELRDLIDPGALARVEDDLQHRSPLTRATSADALHDVLRRVGDLRTRELGERVLAELDAEAMLAALERERRAVRIRVGGEERVIAADDAGLYRDALGVPPPPGLPAAFVADVPDALGRLVERFARTHGPFTSTELQARYGVDASAVLRELERAGTLVRGELRPRAELPSRPARAAAESGSPGGEVPESGSPGRTAAAPSSPGRDVDGREWCDLGVLRTLRRASLAALRKEIEPVDAQALTAFMPAWQGIDRYPPATGAYRRGSERQAGSGSAAPPIAAGVERLREALGPLQALALPAAAWERDVLPARTGPYSPTWLDALCASGELAWVGAGALGRSSGRVALYFREDAPLLGPPAPPVEAPSRPEHSQLRERLAAAPCFFGDLLVDLDLPAAALTEALWDLVWAGEATNDAFAPLRAPRLSLAGAAASARASFRGGGRRRFASRSLRGGRLSPAIGGSPAGSVQGRWSLTDSIFDGPRSWGEHARGQAEGGGPVAAKPGGAAEHANNPPIQDPRARRRALAELLLERYGVLTREQVLAEGVQGGFSALYPSLTELETLGVCRRGYFVEGLGGAQFALPGAVERLRATRGEDGPRARVLAAVDPAQPYGAVLPWPRRERAGRRPARVGGAYVALVDAGPVLYLERGGRSLLTLADDPHPPAGEPGRLELALRALADAVRAGRIEAVSLERVDGAAAIGSPLESALVELGFRQGPRRLVLRA